MDNKELISKLINFDEEDISTGFVGVSKHNETFVDFLKHQKNIKLERDPLFDRLDIIVISDVDVPYPGAEPDEDITWILSTDIKSDDESIYEYFISETEDFDPELHTWDCAYDEEVQENTPEYENIRKHWDRIKEIMEGIVSSYGQ